MATSKSDTIADQLRAAIADTGLSSAELARRAAIDPAPVIRFVAGTRGLTLETAGRICEALGLRLTGATRARGRPRTSKEGRP